MKRHWAYFKYVMRHKWYVFLAGLMTGAPVWNLIIHDWSKFMPIEWKPYAYTFYNRGGSKNEDRGDKHPLFDKAWEHHWGTNPHHWQFWVNTQGNPRPMPEKYVREMVADWLGANKAQGGSASDFADWYVESKKHRNLHPKTYQTLQVVMAEMCLNEIIS